MPNKFNQQQLKKRKDGIVTAALRIASQPGGWGRLTRASIANEAGCSEALVSTYLGSMDAVRILLVKTAVKRENYGVLAGAMAAGIDAAIALPKSIKSKVYGHVTGV